MEYQNILVNVVAPHVAAISLNRPNFLNTFSTAMACELYDAMMSVEKNPQIRVIIIKGEGKAFCAGIDINELEGKSAMQYREWIEQMEKPLVAISKIKKPVIAQVQGVAAANGMGLVASADLAIAADNVKMGLTAINVGLNCVGPVIPVAKSVGRKRAMELLLSGRLIKADEALSMGLLNKIVPKDSLEQETLKWASEFATKSPIAVQIAKSAFYTSEDLEYTKQFDYMNEAFARLCSTDDAKEGVKAFLEKRNPLWQEK